MRTRRGVHISKLKHSTELSVLLVLAGCFLCGTVAGCVWANGVAECGGEALSAYINGYLAVLREGTSATEGLPGLLWETVRWPLFAVLLGFTALGMLAIPALFVVRGFLLSFSVSCLICVLGSTGAILALLLFGIGGALGIPVFFVLGVQGVIAGRQLCRRLIGTGQRTEGIYGKRYFVCCGVCAVALVVCVCLERMAIPALLKILAGTF